MIGLCKSSRLVDFISFTNIGKAHPETINICFFPEKKFEDILESDQPINGLPTRNDSHKIIKLSTRSLRCRNQCNVMMDTCKMECHNEGLNECRLIEPPHKIDVDSQFIRTLFCGDPQATIINNFSYKVKFCSGVCTSITRPKERTRYSRFVNRYLFHNSNLCTPTGFEPFDVLCSLNNNVYVSRVQDFLISGCACGVVPLN